MKYLIYIVAITFFFNNNLKAQDKVNWKAKYDWDTKEIVIEATIADGWHLYSQHIKNDVGPVPTAFEYKSETTFKLVGETNEPKAIEKFDENFGATLNFFMTSAVFRQKIKAEKGTTITITITFMVCNDVMCLPPVDIQIPITLI